MTGYQLTQHARQRLAERDITPDDLAGALSGDCADFGAGRVIYYDRGRRVEVVTSRADCTIITIVRHSKRTGRRLVQAMRHEGKPV